MPRYYFHVAGDDEQGIVLPDDVSARAMAKQTFATMLLDGDISIGDFLEVVDDSGRRVVMLRLLAEG